MGTDERNAEWETQGEGELYPSGDDGRGADRAVGSGEEAANIKH